MPRFCKCGSGMQVAILVGDKEMCWACAPDIREAVRKDKMGNLKAMKIAGVNRQQFAWQKGVAK